jgi:hypothetical protein
MKNTVILLGIILLSITIIQKHTYKKETKNEFSVEKKIDLETVNVSISLENMPVVFIKRD